MGAVTLSETLNVTQDEAQKLISEFKSTFPGVNKYFNECLIQCRSMGLVKTLSGRIRHFPDINSKVPKIKCTFLFILYLLNYKVYILKLNS